MIKLLDKYIFTHVLMGTLLVLFVLTSINAFLELLNQFEDVGRHQYGSLQAAIYVFYTLPGRIYELLPSATLIGSLVGLGTLASSSQITAMRAAGVSVLDFIFSSFKSGLLIALLAFVLGEWLSPVSWQLGEEMRATALSEQLNINRKGGLWLRDQNRFMHAGSVIDDRHLKDVTVYSFKGLELTSVTQADSVELKGSSWVMSDAMITSISKQQVVSKAGTSVDLGQLVPEGMLDVLRIVPEQMSGRDLFQYIKYMHANDLDGASYQLAFVNRFIHPLTILVMMFISVPFLFAHQRGGGAGQRLFFGVLLGLSFYILNKLFNELGVVYGVPVLISALLVPMIAVASGWYFVRKI